MKSEATKIFSSPHAALLAEAQNHLAFWDTPEWRTLKAAADKNQETAKELFRLARILAEKLEAVEDSIFVRKSSLEDILSKVQTPLLDSQRYVQDFANCLKTMQTYPEQILKLPKEAQEFTDLVDEYIERMKSEEEEIAEFMERRAEALLGFLIPLRDLNLRLMDTGRKHIDEIGLFNLLQMIEPEKNDHRLRKGLWPRAFERVYSGRGHRTGMLV